MYIEPRILMLIAMGMLALLAVLYMLWPLLRRAENVEMQAGDDGRREQNIAIVREQLADLEQSLESGEIDDQQYAARQDELERGLYLDISNQESVAEQRSNGRSGAMLFGAGFLALGIPLAALALYWQLGTPDIAQKLAAANKPKSEIPLNAEGKPDVEKMVYSLHQSLRKEPDNPRGWYMLGRAFMTMQNFDGAVESYQNLLRLQPEEPDVMLMLADALSMKQRGVLLGRPAKLVEKALLKAPENTTGLWLSGMVMEQQKDFKGAKERWEGLLPLLNDKPKEQDELRKLIARVSNKINGAGSTDSQATTNARVTLQITLDNSFKDKASPEQMLFVYAKAQQGPPMPLAAQRLQVKDLPLSITLDDSMAMMPAMKISMFGELIVGARISNTGNAIAQDGDLYAEQENVKHGDVVALTINQVLKK